MEENRKNDQKIQELSPETMEQVSGDQNQILQQLQRNNHMDLSARCLDLRQMRPQHQRKSCRFVINAFRSCSGLFGGPAGTEQGDGPSCSANAELQD